MTFPSPLHSPPLPRQGRIERSARSREGHIIGLERSGADLRKEDSPIIGGLSHLETLDLSGTKVSDDDLRHLV
jgi:hypothetical protein